MADHGRPGQRRPMSGGFASNSGSAGRGPTYERVQRLLEERRARSQGQSSGGGRSALHEGSAASLERARLEAASPTPDSDESFAFDRPATVSGGGILDEPQEPLRGSYQGGHPAQHRLRSGGPDMAYGLHPWQSAAQFELPPGHLDEEEDEGDDGGGLHSGLSSQPQHLQQLPLDYDFDQGKPAPEEPEPEEEDGEDHHDHYDSALSPERPGGRQQPSLAELEEMFNHTMLGMAGATAMRVPSSKDMALGMAQGDGPFDISDIWAMDSQPSGSQRSASNRQMSEADTEASRDEGQEADSYRDLYSRAVQQHLPQQQQQQQHPPLSRESSDMAGGQPPGQLQPPGRTFSPRQTPSGLRGRPVPSLQARLHPDQPQRAGRQPPPHQQQQQQQRPPPQRSQYQQPSSPRPGSAAAGGRDASAAAAARQAESIRRLQQHHAMFSAHKGGAPQSRAGRQQQPPPQQQAQQQRPQAPRGQQAEEPVGVKRPGGRQGGSPGAPQEYRPSQPRVSPRAPLSARHGQGQGHTSAVVALRDREEELTFRPQINPRSREIAERLLPVDRERRLEQLSRPRNDKLEQRYEQLRQAKELEEMKDCTFQPQTGRPPSIPRLRGNVPVHDRLYNVKPAWQLKRDDILREREEAVLANCTFQPQCGSRQTPEPARRASSAPRRRPASAAAAVGGGGGGAGGSGVSCSSSYVPIHQRVADLLRSRNEKLAKAQIKMELGGVSVTFQPEINRRSVHLAAERQRQQPAEVAALPAGERLYRLAQEQVALQGFPRRRDDGGAGPRDVSAPRDQRRGGYRQQQQQQPSGVPSINPRSRALAESSDLPQDFLARQAYLAALGHEKRALYRSLLEESTCTFQPQLLSRGNSFAFGSGSGGFSFGPHGGSSGQLSGSSQLFGSGGDRVSKLAYEDVQRSAALREALEQHHYGQFTFAPAINERSRRIGRRHSLTDLYHDDERQAKLERLVAATEAQRAAECTFRPAINARSASLGRQRRGSLVLASSADCHEQANKLRSSILTEARALREYEELKECTFTPAINRTVPKTAGPVAVPGLGRHMELRDLARRKREAEEARKAEVWNARPRSPGPKAGFTIPRPFSFETRVMPWQIPRAQQAQQQQEQEQQQRKALTALKQQRQQQRKDAEDRRSAQLRRILQETQAGADPMGQSAADEEDLYDDLSNAGGGSYGQNPHQQAGGGRPGFPRPAIAGRRDGNGFGDGGNGQPQIAPNGARRRSVTFQSPVGRVTVATEWNGDDDGSSSLAFEERLPGEADEGGYGAEDDDDRHPGHHHHGHHQRHQHPHNHNAGFGVGEGDEEYGYAGRHAGEELSLRFGVP